MGDSWNNKKADQQNTYKNAHTINNLKGSLWWWPFLEVYCVSRWTPFMGSFCMARYWASLCVCVCVCVGCPGLLPIDTHPDQTTSSWSCGLNGNNRWTTTFSEIYAVRPVPV